MSLPRDRDGEAYRIVTVAHTRAGPTGTEKDPVIFVSQERSRHVPFPPPPRGPLDRLDRRRARAARGARELGPGERAGHLPAARLVAHLLVGRCAQGRGGHGGRASRPLPLPHHHDRRHHRDQRQLRRPVALHHHRPRLPGEPGERGRRPGSGRPLVPGGRLAAVAGRRPDRRGSRPGPRGRRPAGGGLAAVGPGARPRRAHQRHGAQRPRGRAARRGGRQERAVRARGGGRTAATRASTPPPASP